MSRFQYLTVGYGLIWLSLGVYLLLMNRRIARVKGEIDELRRRLSRGEGGGA